MSLAERLTGELHDKFTETELSAENLITGICGSFLEQDVVQLREVPTVFRNAYVSAQEIVRAAAVEHDLVLKKELALNTEGDYGFALGITELSMRRIATLSTCETILRLNRFAFVQTVNFWRSLPGTKDLYDTVTAAIMNRYSNYS